MADELVHSKKVQKLIGVLRTLKEPLFLQMKSMYAADNRNMFPLDWIMQIACKRALSNASGIADLIEGHNMVSARALLRVHIDGLVRLYAFTLVDRPHDLAIKVIAGEKLSHMKDRNGTLMRDAHLIEQLGKEFDWLPKVYKNTSGFIHLSRELLGFTMQPKEQDSFAVQISDKDDLPEEYWIEVIECHVETSRILLSFVGSWTHTKEEAGRNRP